MFTKSEQIYLAGAIERAPDGGSTWRYEITPDLKNLGYDVFNPCIETDGLLAKKLGWDEFDIQKWRQLKKYDAQLFKSIGEWIVREDLDAVKRSQVLLVYFDKYVTQGAGTYGEMTVARLLDIPVLLIVAPEFNKEDIPLWALGCTDIIFDSTKAALEYFGKNNE